MTMMDRGGSGGGPMNPMGPMGPHGMAGMMQQPPMYQPPAALYDDDPGIMSEVETSATGLRRGAKARSSLPIVRTPNKTNERPLGELTYFFNRTAIQDRCMPIKHCIFFCMHVHSLRCMCSMYHMNVHDPSSSTWKQQLCHCNHRWVQPSKRWSESHLKLWWVEGKEFNAKAWRVSSSD